MAIRTVAAYDARTDMRLLDFQVQGYKNFLAPLRLADLGRFNVVHGDNNVGKSNLLESIELFFLALEVLSEEARGGPGLAERYTRGVPVADATHGKPSREVVRSFDYFVRKGYSPATGPLVYAFPPSARAPATTE